MPPEIREWVESVMEYTDISDVYAYAYGALLVHFGAQYSALPNGGEQYIFENWIVQFLPPRGLRVNYTWDEDGKQEERLLRHIKFFNTEEE